MATEDQILLKLIISGQSPAEIQRLAASTQGELNDRMKVYLDHLTQLHADAARAQTAEDQKRAKAAIDAAEAQIDVVAKVARAHEIAANRASNGWRRTMEDLENFTVVMFGAIQVAEQIASSFKKYGEEIDKVTNVYGSLKGSIDEMREASRGEIADIDLITTKNRAFEKDLHLTDAQLGQVASAADNFADSLGLNTKDALDKIIDGLATGRLKMLEHAGVVIDTDKVYAAYGKTVGVAADQLSVHAKKVALIEASLKAMDEKIIKSGAAVNDFSHEWERTSAILQNTWDKIALGVGKLVVEIIQAFTIDIPNAVKIGFAKWKDMIPGTSGTAEAQARAAYGAELEKFSDAGGAAKQIADAKARIAGDGSAYKYTDGSDSPNQSPKAAAEAAKKQAERAAQWDAMMRKAYAKSDEGYGFDPSVGKTPNLDALGFSESTAMGNEEGNRLEQGSIDALLDKATGGTKGQSLKEQVEKFEKDFIEPLKLKTAAYQAELDATKEKAGGGLFAVLLFGPDGPDKTYAEMDAFQQATVEVSGMVADTMHKMAEAVGQSLANWVSDSQGAKKSFRDTTNELMVSLSAQAYTQGIMELAKAAASAASYDYTGAEQHLLAAAAFAAVGTAAGLGARAVGHSAAAGSSSATGSGIASRGSSSSIGSSSSSSSGSSAPLTINLTVLPGGEAEAGRAINKALSAYYAQTGKGVKAA